MELQLLIRRDDPSLDTIPVVNNRELSLAVAKQTIVTRTEELVSEEVIDIIFARLSKGEPGKSAYQAAVEAGYTLSEAEFNRDLATISELAGAVEDKVGKEEFNTLKEDVENITAEYKVQLDNLEQALDDKVDKVDGKQLSTEDFTTEYKEQLDTLIENGGNGSDGELRELFNLMFEYDESLNAIQAKLPLYSLGSITAKGQGASSGSGGGGTAYNRLDNWNDYGEGKEGYVLSAYLGYSLYEQLLNKLDANGTAKDSEKLGGLYASNYVTNDGLSDLAHKTGTYEDLIAGGLVGYTLPTRDQNQTIALAAKGDIPQEIRDLSDGETLLSTIDDFNTDIVSLISFKETFEKMFSLDTDNVIKAKLPLYSLGSITAKGKGVSSGSGGGGTAYNRLDKWGDYTSDKADYVLSAGLGWDLNTRISNKFDSANFTKANLKNTLGISDWALAATKPSYAWSEITSRPTALSQLTDDVVDGNYLHSVRYSDTWDADSIYNAGIFSGRISHLPSGEPYGRILSLPYYNDKSEGTQNFVAHLFITNGDDTTTPNEMYFRTSQRNSWNAWNRVITDKNISNYALPITGGTINTAASTPLNIKNTQSNPTDVGISFMYNNDLKGWIGYETQRGTMLYTYNGSHRLGIKDDGTAYVDSNTLIHSGNIKDQYVAGVYDSYNPLNKITFKYAGGGVTSNPAWLACWNDYTLTYVSPDNVKAGSATKLATAHTLWGQSFDGTANIGGDITLNAFQDGRQLSIQQSGGIKFSTPSGNGWVTSLNIYASDKTTLLTSAFGVYGIREDVQYAFIGGTYDLPNVVVQDDTGYVGIGTINPEERLHVSGTIKSCNLSVSNQIGVKTIVGKGFGLYSSDTNPYLELNQNGKVAYLQMMGDNGMVALGSAASKSLVVNAAGFVSVNRGCVNPTEALDVGGNILASGNVKATSVTIGGVTLSWDSVNNALVVNGNMYGTGSITAKKSA